MSEIVKALILDFQELPLYTGVPRRLNVTPVSGKATVCIGVRRSGKSTYLNQQIAGLLERGVARENILYLNLFDDRLHDLVNTGPGVVLEAYFGVIAQSLVLLRIPVPESPRRSLLLSFWMLSTGRRALGTDCAWIRAQQVVCV